MVTVVGWMSRQELETDSCLIIWFYFYNMHFCLWMWYACVCDCEIRERRPGRWQKFVFICLRLLVQTYTETTRNFSTDRESLNQTLDLGNTKQWAWLNTDCIYDIPWVFLVVSMMYTTSSLSRRRTGHPRWLRVSKVSSVWQWWRYTRCIMAV